MSNATFLRRATLIDKNYHAVTEVAVPSSIPWPEAIRYNGRIFTQYAYTKQVSPETDRRTELECTYREIKVWNANPTPLV